MSVISGAGTNFGVFTDRDEAHRFAHGVAATDGVRLPVRVVEYGKEPYEVRPDFCGANLGQCLVDQPVRAGSFLISQWAVHRDRTAPPAT